MWTKSVHLYSKLRKRASFTHHKSRTLVDTVAEFDKKMKTVSIIFYELDLGVRKEESLCPSERGLGRLYLSCSSICVYWKDYVPALPFSLDTLGLRPTNRRSS